MASALVDSSVLIAAANDDDLLHQDGQAIVHGIDHGELPRGRVTGYVVAEVLNYLHGRLSHGLAVEFYDRLTQSAGFRIEAVTKHDFQTAIEHFRTREGLSFVDATIVAAMGRLDIEVLYSFDDDFDQVTEITRLDVAENPFD